MKKFRVVDGRLVWMEDPLPGPCTSPERPGRPAAVAESLESGLELYRDLQAAWARLRDDGKADTSEADDLLDRMDRVWYSLTEEQMAKVNEGQ